MTISYLKAPSTESQKRYSIPVTECTSELGKQLRQVLQKNLQLQGRSCYNKLFFQVQDPVTVWKKPPPKPETKHLWEINKYFHSYIDTCHKVLKQPCSNWLNLVLNCRKKVIFGLNKNNRLKWSTNAFYMQKLHTGKI